MNHTIRRSIGAAAAICFAVAGSLLVAQPAQAAGPDLAVTIDHDPAQIINGQPAEYSVTVTNVGDATYDPAGDDLGYFYILLTPSQGQIAITSVDPSSCRVVTTTLRSCDLPVLGVGASFTATVTAVTDGTQELRQFARVHSSIEVNEGNSTMGEFLPVFDLADVGVALDATAGLSQISYDLEISNDGPRVATSATVVVDVPAQTSSVPSPPAGCTYNAAVDEVSCTVASLAVGASTTRSFTANLGLLTLGSLPATATRTTSSPLDNEGANDTASANCSALTSLLITC